MENRRPLILISNDDGIMAKGISELKIKDKENCMENKRPLTIVSMARASWQKVLVN